MRFTQAFIPTLRDTPSDAEVISHQLMLRAGYLRKLSSGIYNYLPLGLRVIQKIESIIRHEMKKAGAQELLMPMVQPSDLWKESGRWDVYDKELLRFKDRHDNDYCLGPTHEEIITDIVRGEVKSYKQLPLSLYQIQTKFRDEIRPRFGLMRGREFLMKDCYSFDANEEGALKSYDIYYQAYKRIFETCSLSFRAVEADTGTIGGNRSHEFQVLAESGEDAIVGCSHCDYAANIEKAESQEGETCKRCQKGQMKAYRGIEVGQVFYLGTKYSEALGARFLDENGKENPFVMGCYGIGIGRTAAAAIEQNHDENGIIWPLSIAPYQVILISLSDDDAVIEKSKEIYDKLNTLGVEVIWDDRDQRAGVKFKDADLLGIPSQVVIGKRGLEKSQAEFKERSHSKKQEIALDQLIDFIKGKLDSCLQKTL